MWSSLGAVISVVFVFATSIDQVHSLRCYEEEGVPLNIRPFEYSIAGSRPTACCVELFLNGIVNYVSVEMHDKKKWFGGAHENFCQLQAKKHRFVCCCKENFCNSNEHLQYNFHNYLAMMNKEKGISAEKFVLLYIVAGIAVSVVVAVVVAKIVIGQWETHSTTEAHQSKYFEEKCAIILPQMGKGEMKQLKSQMKYARTTQRPQVRELRGQPVITGVFTYSTNSVVTNRQLGPVEVKIPKNGVTDFMDILMQMVSIGPREMKFPYKMLEAICDEVKKIFLAEATLLDVPVPCQVYGDIHGQYSDLLRFFHLNGWPPTVRCVFLGDYVDRGRHGLEVIVLLFVMKICMPYDVYIVRGNHEDAIINRSYSFLSEIEYRIPANENGHLKVMSKFIDTFTSLPLAVRIGKRALGMHGGLSPKLVNWESILNIRRPCNLRKGTIQCDLTWSDPDSNVRGYEPNLKRDPNGGMGYQFGADAVDRVCQSLKIDVIFRGHQCPMPGYELFSERCITLFTAPGYRSSSEGDCNYGGSLFIDHDFRMTITRIGVDNTVRVLRDIQKLDKGEKYNDMGSLQAKEHHDDD